MPAYRDMSGPRNPRRFSRKPAKLTTARFAPEQSILTEESGAALGMLPTDDVCTIIATVKTCNRTERKEFRAACHREGIVDARRMTFALTPKERKEAKLPELAGSPSDWGDTTDFLLTAPRRALALFMSQPCCLGAFTASAASVGFRSFGSGPEKRVKGERIRIEEFSLRSDAERANRAAIALAERKAASGETVVLEETDSYTVPDKRSIIVNATSRQQTESGRII